MTEVKLATQQWQVVSASVTGSSHIQADLPCQDACSYLCLPNGYLVAAVADRAGSAKLGDVRASLAVKTSIDTVHHFSKTQPVPNVEVGWKDLLQVALAKTLAAIHQEAESRVVNPRDLATTLILWVSVPGLVAEAQVGDGAVVIADHQNNLFALTTPQSGEHINETTFLLSVNDLATA